MRLPLQTTLTNILVGKKIYDSNMTRNYIFYLRNNMAHPESTFYGKKNKYIDVLITHITQPKTQHILVQFTPVWMVLKTKKASIKLELKMFDVT